MPDRIPQCHRCDDTGLDPDHYATEQYDDGSTRYLAEPCHDCQQVLIHYLEQRAADRAGAVNAVLAQLTDRERALVKDAAVMGYVQGRRHPEGEPHPRDGHVLVGVIDACLAHPDLYPAINPPPDDEEGTDRG